MRCLTVIKHFTFFLFSIYLGRTSERAIRIRGRVLQKKYIKFVFSSENLPWEKHTVSYRNNVNQIAMPQKHSLRESFQRKRKKGRKWVRLPSLATYAQKKWRKTCQQTLTSIRRRWFWCYFQMAPRARTSLWIHRYVHQNFCYFLVMKPKNHFSELVMLFYTP